jgi:hypothetical protein
MAESAPLLLQLPDPCLLAVLQCCSSDLVSLFSAARAHSRLHQAAVLALSSIPFNRVKQQQQVDGLLQYLSAHGQHVNIMEVGLRYPPYYVCSGTRITLRQLPPSLQLQSLKLTYMNVQLQPGHGSLGVLRTGLPLTQLQLSECTLCDFEEGWIAALACLPGLQHLSIVNSRTFQLLRFSMGVISGLQQLTYLELAGNQLERPDSATPALQPLSCLTQLADLRLACGAVAINSSMLSGARHLTLLAVSGPCCFTMGALAALTQLQHLTLKTGRMPHVLLQQGLRSCWVSCCTCSS